MDTSNKDTAMAGAFDLPEHLGAKADPRLIADDERHFASLDDALRQTVRDLTERLAAAKKGPRQLGQEALERDMEVNRLGARLRSLGRFGLDLCLGRMVMVGQSEPVYIGRLGLTDDAGHRLLIDWRSPAAEPFFGATHAHPMGLASRRRYRWNRGRINDYWDEAFTADGLADQAALDDQSAFIASLGTNRTARMRDVIGTIQADQDAIIRASSRGPLVVDGGPGTGKTVVALHRAAYLLYSDPRLGHHLGSILFIGPHRPYLAYVSDVLPSLGEEGVQTCTLADLVPEGADALPEPNPLATALKSTADMVRAVRTAVGFFEEPPTDQLVVQTPYSDIRLDAADWADAFAAAAPGTPHNEARESVWEELLTILIDRTDPDEVPEAMLRTELLRNRDLVAAFDAAWPLLEPANIIAGMFSVPNFLHMCAPWLEPGQIRLLQRADPHAWTVADLPLLDAARLRLGDARGAQYRRRQELAAASERELMDRVVGDLIESDDSELMVMSMLRVDDMAEKLVDHDAVPVPATDRLAGPFAHIVVDEAQELNDAQWQMLLQRCPSRSLTIVGDRAQARHGFTESWEQRLERIGLDRVVLASLSINYRTPREVMVQAERVIREALPDANVPLSIRSSGVPVRHGSTAELDAVLDQWLASHPEGTGAVIGDPGFAPVPRVGSLTPELAKGLEFDLVVLVDPDAFGTGIEGAVDRYVAMTRATGQLVILTGS